MACNDAENSLCRGLVWLTILATPLCGCTPLKSYIHNGFKVGPNYTQPPAPIAPAWIDADDQRVRCDSDDLSQWWRVFNDPTLDWLVCLAYRQNLSLREAGFRVLQARAQLCIDAGRLYPQLQAATGDFVANGTSRETAMGALFAEFPGAPFFYSQWDLGFTLAWELDFWGRFRRAVEADAANLQASVAGYDTVLVTLLGDVAASYVQMRTLQQRIKYAQKNADLQRETLTLVESRLKAGTVSDLDMHQARSTLERTEAQIPELEIGLRQVNNQLCILLGIPPEELRDKLGPGEIPTAPLDVAAGIPAELLRRRPDVRRAERQAAAQCARIGIAEADFYPAVSITGTVGYSAEDLPRLFQSTAFRGNVGPSFHWNILNYGRIRNNVGLQTARFQELLAAYQQTVLNAHREVENGLVTFLKAHQRTKSQAASVDDADKAVKLGLIQYGAGTVDFTRVTQLEQTLVPLEDVLAQARGQIATGLIDVYRALGGGWEIRCTGGPTTTLPPEGPTEPAGELLPLPVPEPIPAPPAPTPERPEKAL